MAMVQLASATSAQARTSAVSTSSDEKTVIASVFTAQVENGPYAQAQTSKASAPDEDDALQEGEVEVVTVVGYRGSLNRSSDAKRRADQVIDVITAEEFGKFPDQNVAEAIQRIPGISMERAEGKGDKITIRGLEPDLTRVEINGRSTLIIGNVETPDMASSLSVFGSDQFARIEVVKTSQAKDDEGGVGGILRLITPRPFDIRDFAARVSAQARYNDYSGEVDPVYTALISDLLLDGTLGISLFASYDDRTRRNDQTRSLNGWLPAPASQTGRPGTEALRGKVYATHFDQQFRIGTLPRTNLDFTIQFRPTGSLEFYANANWAHEDRLDRISRVAINTARNPPFIQGTSTSKARLILCWWTGGFSLSKTGA